MGASPVVIVHAHIADLPRPGLKMRLKGFPAAMAHASSRRATRTFND
jgi:hypothetical protein